METTVSNTLQVFSKEEINANVRVIEIYGQYWFVAADVCKSLDIGTTAKALARLDNDEKGMTSIHTLGGQQQMSIVN